MRGDCGQLYGTDLSRFIRRKVEVIVIFAAGIEKSAAMRAAVAAVHVFPDRHFGAACTAKDRSNVPFLARPNLDSVARENFVALLAGVVDAAAGHPDGDDVERGAVVAAARLSIQLDSANFWSTGFHLLGLHLPGLHLPIRTQS